MHSDAPRPSSPPPSTSMSTAPPPLGSSNVASPMSTSPPPAEDGGAAPTPTRLLQDSLARIKTAAHALDRAARQGARVEGGIMNACLRALEDVLAVSDAYVEEDFHLLTTLGKQLDSNAAFDASLMTRMSGMERVMEALASARALDALSLVNAQSESLEEEYELATRRVVAKVLAVVELHEATRADRIKLLADLVTASRLE
jgi:hypothetical protein